MTYPLRRPDVRRPLVVNVSRYLPQYRVAFYEVLRPTLAAQDIDFVYIHGQPGPAEAVKGDAATLGWETLVRNRVVPIGRGGVWWQPCLSIVRKADLVIVEQGARLLLNYGLAAAQRWSGPRLAFWGHGRHFAAHEVTGVGETLKAALARRAHWWFAYTERSARVVEGLGYPRERITVVQNAVDTRALREWRAALTSGDLALLRESLGLGDGPVGVYCGALYREKRLGFLVEACDRVREALPSFELLVVGGGEDESLVRAAAATRPWLHYVGPRFGREKVAHLALGDLFLMPGLVGLAILDAFALELPLVTTAVDYHSHEIEYLEDGRNGRLVTEPDDPSAYAHAVVGLLRDRDALERLRAGCRETASEVTVERMVERFCGGVVAALDAPRLRRRRTRVQAAPPA